MQKVIGHADISSDVRDLMVTTAEHRFGQVNKLPHTIKWLIDNGRCYTAHDTRRFARDIGLVPHTNPVGSPQISGKSFLSNETMPVLIQI
jgi:putative transposase